MKYASLRPCSPLSCPGELAPHHGMFSVIIVCNSRDVWDHMRHLDMQLSKYTGPKSQTHGQYLSIEELV